MKTVRKSLSELRHPDRNPRMHSDKQLKEFRRSVEMFGQIRPIVCDERGTILAGNGLYETLVSMGWTEADCYVLEGLTEAEKKKLMLADNRIYSLGVDDMDAFDAIIAELAGDLDVPGYDEDILATISASTEEIDDALSEYGLIDTDRREQMETAGQKPVPGKTKAAEPEKEDAPSPAPEPERRCVICPNCGETVWL